MAFQSALVTLLNQVPLETNIDELAQYWPYFYERSIGCVGVLKDWLIRAVAATLTEGSNKLVLQRIQECALPLAQCESMAIDATSGEQELHYTASQRQNLWKLLGMNNLSEAPPVERPSEPPISPTQHPRTGEQHPVRHEVGAPKNQKETGNCSFSGQKVEISISELEQSGVTKIQCPECGAVWAAKIKGGMVFFANHAAPTRKRSQAIPRWMKVSIHWTLAQR